MLTKLLKKRFCSKWLFYFLNFTWGLLLTLVGSVYALLFIITLHKPKRFGYCIAFESKYIGGGLSVGIFIFTCKNPTDYLLQHEHGHAIQNAFYGPLMPFIVSIPSFTRYHYRNIKRKVFKKKNKTLYDAIWFEAEATALGAMLAENINTAL